MPEPLYVDSTMPDKFAEWVRWLARQGKRVEFIDNPDDPDDPLIRVVDVDER